MKFLLCICLALVAAIAFESVSEAGCRGGRIFGGLRARRQARVENRQGNRDVRVERRDARRAEAEPEQIKAPQVEREDRRLAMDE